jgi:transcriptional/translational regulatory protein YebC/TACO1
VRHAFSKAGGNLGTDGSVAYLFDRKGQILFEPGTSEDDVMEIAIESGADDVETEDDGSITVSTTADDYLVVKDALVTGGLEPAASEVAMIPQNYSELDVDMGEKVLRLVDALEDLDDVTNVYTNAKFPDELMG